MENKFQVNDRVKGMPNPEYCITDENMIEARVLAVSDDGERIDVKVTAHKTKSYAVGSVYNGLKVKYFELVRRPVQKPFNRLEALAALVEDKSALIDYDLSSADLSGADLSGADLSGADLRSADLSGADLSGADLSGADGIMSAIAFMDAHFERTPDGFIAYKTFGSSYSPNSDWKIEPGSVLTEVVNPDRTCSCGCGINVAPLSWVKDNATNGGRLSIWKVLIRWEWLMGVVVPFGSDGKVRCEKVELIEVVK